MRDTPNLGETRFCDLSEKRERIVAAMRRYPGFFAADEAHLNADPSEGVLLGTENETKKKMHKAK